MPSVQTRLTSSVQPSSTRRGRREFKSGRLSIDWNCGRRNLEPRKQAESGHAYNAAETEMGSVSVITIPLMGGLGNQLFEWALGQAFAHRGNEVQYDTALFDGDPGRRYMLDQLGLDLKLSHHGGSGQIIQEGSMRYKPGLLDMFSPSFVRTDVDGKQISLKDDATLIGYWQCEKYFAELDDCIRDMLDDPEATEQTHDVAATILDIEEHSCFVHVRRTDNLRPAGITVHGLLCHEGYQYYERSMNWMRDRVPGVHFFVFSDDAEWCRKNFVAPDITVVHHNAPSFTVDAGHDIHWKAGGREVEDLWLMSLCRHAIIANSSFSWWGAWLGDAAPNRLVIAPEPWFAAKNLDSADICPERWMKIGIK